jgi:predicted N-acyltransferase
MLSARVPSSINTEIVDWLAGVEAAEWNRLVGDDPFLRYEFLQTLEDARCVGGRSGWQPRFVLLREGGTLAAAMPLYRKTHSLGEYVFDWAWADAYRRHGLRYYPKLVCAVPFTPATGSRLLARTPSHRGILLAAALDLAAEQELSSLHILFPPQKQAIDLRRSGLLLREGVQFHWCNARYENFEHFLSTLKHDKRKKIRQERRRVRESGITFRRLNGYEASIEDWRFFARCYERTYRLHGSSPYLNFEFFRELAARMPENVLLIIGEISDERVAGSFAVHNSRCFYGRYWGAIDYFPALHFETCYYQAIEFCIERGISIFEGGAQGAHKLSRGFLPVKTYSAHWLAHPEFARAIDEYVRAEARGISSYVDELELHAPFKHEARR